MFNLQGSEIIFILLIALVVLGPEKLPGAIRRVTSLYSELRKLSSGFQDEFKSVLDEPLREIRGTADLVKGAADPKRIAEEAEREAELAASADKKAKQARDTTAAMEAAGAAHLAASHAADPVDGDESGAGDPDEPAHDAFADPVDDTETSTADASTPDTSTPQISARPDVPALESGDDSAAEVAVVPVDDDEPRVPAVDSADDAFERQEKSA